MCVKQSFISKEQKRKDFFLRQTRKKAFLNSVKLWHPSDALPLTVKERKEAAWKETISSGWPASYTFVGKKKKQKQPNIVFWRQRDIFSLFNYLILKMHLLGTIRDVPSCTLIYQLTEVKAQSTISLFIVTLTPAYPSVAKIVSQRLYSPYPPLFPHISHSNRGTFCPIKIYTIHQHVNAKCWGCCRQAIMSFKLH